MDIHGAAAAAFIENEPPAPENREGELPKNTLMKPHGPEFQPAIAWLSRLL